MKRILFAALMALGLMGWAQELTVGSYNIRLDCEYDRERGHSWDERVPYITDLLEFVMPDAFGTQETLDHQLQDMLRLLPEYDYIGTGREGPREGEYSSIFYNREKLRPLRSSTFWLSETPDTVSRGWDAVCHRVCTWGEFEIIATGDTIYFFNLHMDHIGTEARRNGAKLVVERMAEIAPKDAKIILTGDFNVDQHDEIYSIFTASGLIDSYEAADRRFATNGTFNNYKSDSYTDSRIDHVFVSPALHPYRYAILTDAYWVVDPDAATTKGAAAPQEIDFSSQQRRLPSDHYPVFVKLRY
ncbi:MAG: endonuclease/exonuclease/phosphatase family protein [Bacteroidales bacterium]|nr:endonuclease/exonuclease/phosphatase family protein [Bacteroidales bacterium]